jgi:hypothetical protein
MEDKKISPEESLQIIEQMLADTRNRFYNNGFSFLFWGVLIILDCVVTYFMNIAGYGAETNYVWYSTFIIIPVYVLAIFWYYSKFRPARKKKSRLDYINGMLWLAFGASCLVLIFICAQLNADMGPFTFCLLGLCMFASGGMYKFWWLYAGAVVFWLGAIASAMLKDSEINLLVCAAVMFLGYIIPGYLLWKKAKKEAHV